MLQVPVSKQGRYQFTRWHDRVATFDRQHLCVFLSKKDDVNLPYYHKLHVKTVRLWPQYPSRDVHDWDTSPEAILTLQVKGVELPVTLEDKERVLQHSCDSHGAGDAMLGTCDSSSSNKKGSSSASTVLSSVPSGPTFSEKLRDADRGVCSGAAATVVPLTAEEVKQGKKAVWFLRCCTAEELVSLLAALESLTPASVTMRRVDQAKRKNVSKGSGGPKVVGDIERVKAAFRKATAGDWLGRKGI